MSMGELRELLKAGREIDEEISRVEAQLEFPNPFAVLVPWQYAEKREQLLRKREALLKQKKLVDQRVSPLVEPAEKVIVAKPIDQGKEAGEKDGKHKLTSPSEKRALTIVRVIKELSILKPQM